MKLEYQTVKLRINFKDKNLLIKSLTHKSYDKNNNYERQNFQETEFLDQLCQKLLEIYLMKKGNFG